MLLSFAFACQFASEWRDHSSVNGIIIRFCSVLMLSNFVDIILNLQRFERWLSSAMGQACPRLQARSVTGGGNWSRNSSRNGFWDRYWARTSQLLANFFFFLSLAKVPEVFAKINPAQFPSVASRVAGSRATECSPEGI